MRWSIRLGVALAVVLASLAPAAAAQASVRTPGVRVGPTTYSSTSPKCAYSLDTWPETKGNEVTALHVTAAWSCPNVHPYETFGSIDLEDLTMRPQGTVSTWPVGSADLDVQGAATGSVSDVYSHPKTGHSYQATFQLEFVGLDPATLTSTNDCSTQPENSDVAYFCVFQQEYIVQGAPAVGPPPAPAPVHRSLTLATTDGRSCVIDLDLSATGPGMLSYAGSVPSATCNLLGPPTARPPQLAMINWAQTFAYQDQREPGAPIGNGNFQCWYCASPSSSSGLLPAVSQSTVTYYVGLDMGDLTLATMPSGCTPGEFNWVYCELSASVLAP